MKIFYLFPRSGNAVGVPMSQTWHNAAPPALRQLGHEVEEYYEPTLEQLAGIEGQDPAWVRENQGPFVQRVLEALKELR